MSNGKIGIFCPGHHGDMALCTSILKYKDILWPGKDIVWFTSLDPAYASRLDMLKFNDAISEIREWPCQMDFHLLRTPDGLLIPERKGDCDSLKDLDQGYFPAPWFLLPSPKWEVIHYANIPKMVYGADPSWEWHPYLCFSDEEREMIRDFCAKLPHSKSIMLETNLTSAHFQLSDDVIRNIMQLCRTKFGNCNFIFASKLDKSGAVRDYSSFGDDVISCSQFTIRQCALIHNHCDLFVGVCSGLTVAASCWGNKPVPRVEQCSSLTSYSVIANGPVCSVFADNLSHEEAGRRLEAGVAETLNKFW
jgi:hypothetical protein